MTVSHAKIFTLCWNYETFATYASLHVGFLP